MNIKYDSLIKNMKMKPLILTISGYLLIIIFIIFALLLSISLDSSLWYDWIARMILILSVILNILCFFMSISLILKRYKILMNILALILSITFIVISYPVILEEISIITN